VEGNGSQPLKWVAGIAGSIAAAVIIAWILGVQADVTAMKIAMAKTATSAELSILREQVATLNERVDQANRTLLLIAQRDSNNRDGGHP
jgi:hypothetical protein